MANGVFSERNRQSGVNINDLSFEAVPWDLNPRASDGQSDALPTVLPLPTYM